MSTISKEDVLDLREKTGAGLIDCKRALVITVKLVSGGWYRVISVKWRGDFRQIIGHAKSHLAEANKPNTAITHRILSLR